MNFMYLFHSLPESFAKILRPFISKESTGWRVLLKTYEILASVNLTLLQNISVTEIQMSCLSEKPHSFFPSISPSFINLSNTFSPVSAMSQALY